MNVCMTNPWLSVTTLDFICGARTPLSKDEGKKL